MYMIVHTAAISQKDWWLPSTLSWFLHWSEIVMGAGRAWHDRGSLDLFFGRRLTAHQWDLISACWHITFIELVPSLTPPTAWYTPWVRANPQEAWLVSPHTQTIEKRKMATLLLCTVVRPYHFGQSGNPRSGTEIKFWDWETKEILIMTWEKVKDLLTFAQIWALESH